MAGDAVFLEAGDAVVFLEAGSAFLEVVFTSTDALALPEPRGWPQPLLGRGRGGVQDLDEPPAFGTGLLGIERTDEK